MKVSENELSDLIKQLRTNDGRMMAIVLAFDKKYPLTEELRRFAKVGDYDSGVAYSANVDQLAAALADYNERKARRLKREQKKYRRNERLIEPLIRFWHEQRERQKKGILGNVENIVAQADRIADSNQSLARETYEKAVDLVYSTGDYVLAYQIGVKKGLPHGRSFIKEDFSAKRFRQFFTKSFLRDGLTIDDIYLNGIFQAESFGRYDKATQLEQIRGDTPRVRVYTRLEQLLLTGNLQ